MSLIKKLRAPALALMLSAASIGAFNGCATVNPWQEVRVDRRFRDEGITQRISTKTTKEKSFDISDAYAENDSYKVMIKESLKEFNYRLEGRRKVRNFDEIVVEQRKEETNIGPACLIGLGVLGAIFGAKLTSENTFEGLGGGLLVGMGLGGLIGIAIDPVSTRTETRQGRIIPKQEFSNEEVTSTLVGESFVYRNQPAGNVKFGFKGNNKIYNAGSNGVIDFSVSLENWALTRRGLERKLYDIPLIREIKPRTRDRLRGRLLRAISDKAFEYIIETREESSNPDFIIKNDTQRVKLGGYELPDSAIYKIVQQFVNEEINPSVKTLKLTVKDDLTHVPVRDFNLEFTTDSPSKSELAGRYFTGSLRNYAQKYILDYLNGSGTIRGLPENIELKVYAPSNLFLEITHPEYNFVDGEIPIEGNTKRIAYMVDKGNKIRLQNSGETTGRIEEY